jgi:hypothetical protein
MKDNGFISEPEVEKALDYLRDNADRAAKARAERVYAEEYKRVVRAEIMAEHNELPLAAQERNAYADERYIEHLNALREAVYNDERHRFLLAAAQAKLDCWRTQSSNERANKL